MPRKGEYSSALPGQRFGRLTVISARGKSRRCRCDCGTEIVVQNAFALKSGNTSSCGCLRKEVVAALWTTHGATVGRTETPAYVVWRTMLARCFNPEHPKWHRYGGRGITVCERWLSFEKFHADMGEPPDGKTIDRENNDGNYEPGNCRWATDVEQARNRSNNRIITYRGRSLTVAEWSERTGIKYRTIMARLRYGWSAERTLSEPVHVV